MDSLRLLNRGKLPLRVGMDVVNRAQANADAHETLVKTLASPDNVFLAHTKDFEFFAGNNEKLVNFAAQAGLRREIRATIDDSYGRPVYEVYRFAAAP
jgi:hypothetical protein